MFKVVGIKVSIIIIKKDSKFRMKVSKSLGSRGVQRFINKDMFNNYVQIFGKDGLKSLTSRVPRNCDDTEFKNAI